MNKFGPYDALGTKWWVELYSKVEESFGDKIVEMIKQFEADYSRFSEESLVGQLNKNGSIAGDLKELPAMLRFGQKQFTASNGALNILTGGKQVIAGYGREATVKSNVESIADPSKDLVVTDGEIVLNKGAVDVGSFGKGWLIDNLANYLKSQNIRHFLINGGGDIYVTSLANGLPVEVYVEHPTEPGLYIAKVPLLNQSLAVSSSFKRTWQKDETNFNHLHVSEGVATHVVADSATSADTIATRRCLRSDDAVEVNHEYLLWREGKALCSPLFKNSLLG